MWDLQLLNFKYTWFGPNGKCSRLDKAVINSEWAFSANWTLKGLGRRSSDPSALLLSGKDLNWGPKPYKVFNVWLQDDNLKSLMISTWDSMSSSNLNLHIKMKTLREAIKKWNSGTDGNSIMRVKELEVKLDEGDVNNLDHKQRKVLQDQLSHAYITREAVLRQKSRLQWDKFGDSNTKFFHTVIKNMQQSNNIQGIYWNDLWVENPNEVKLVFYHYYKEFFNRKSTELYFNLGNL